MVVSSYAVVGMVGLAVIGLALLAAAAFRSPPVVVEAPTAWRSHRFGFATYALVFVAFDMEMIFMYPWGAVYREIGLEAFLDMLVFIGLLAGGVAYAWGMGGLRWE